MGTYELGMLDQHLILAILRLRPTAYGISLQDHIQIRAKRTYSIGAIYAALERLEEQGYVASRRGEATKERGGRAKIYFDVTARGQAALQRSLTASDALRTDAGLQGAPA